MIYVQERDSLRSVQKFLCPLPTIWPYTFGLPPTFEAIGHKRGNHASITETNFYSVS